jgi:hypothetical protein
MWERKTCLPGKIVLKLDKISRTTKFLNLQKEILEKEHLLHAKLLQQQKTNKQNK